MKRKYKSEALEAIHESAHDMFEIGLLSEERMRYFDERCLVKSAPETECAPSQKPAGGMRSGAPAYARGK